MKNLFAYLNNMAETLGVKAVYFHLAIKALAAVAGSYLAWIILKRILLSVEKRTGKNIFFKIKTAFDQHGIEIPYPKRDITLIHRSAPNSEVRQPVSNDKTS
jgi:hypothetical protein